ncbi:hypothetical protein L2E82_36786 [Cichorium intybus]|uniref:Uncharacterized protein n=1 Tax=Cichorium intybus TaxID=13427 RepID=A0ACB9AD53_CICIN|nr:hypothetical protein L2E82_36786 [Cichorium intybus]
MYSGTLGLANVDTQQGDILWSASTSAINMLNQFCAHKPFDSRGQRFFPSPPPTLPFLGFLLLLPLSLSSSI